jgi:Mlc titration factor MtfA (ptsG expression regulator)
MFFEQPMQIREKHPELYTALKEFYKQDPAAWNTGAGDKSSS